MNGYTKLFGSIVASTIWTEDDHTRIVWITMLAMADQFGEVAASIPGLAKFANVPLGACEAALSKLMAPDKYSRSKEFEGRRIEEIDGGWKLLNHGKYRDKMNADDRRDYLCRKQRERRERVNNLSTNVNKCQLASTPSTHSEADSEAKAYTKKEEGALFPEVNGVVKMDSVFDIAARQQLLSDEAWLASLQNNPAYSSLNIGHEFSRMVTWCVENHKKPSRRRFVNWINRAEKPMKVVTNVGTATPTNGANTVIMGKEYERIEARITTLRSTYGDMQTWSPDDKKELVHLKERRKELREILGITI